MAPFHETLPEAQEDVIVTSDLQIHLHFEVIVLYAAAFVGS